ncbi:hypothetical protein Psi02_49130 [Planotetraspora silvatica]|uniref:Uncharacterized protein n=1 Tax=Planotetraspora silvatica TaxID=234614 RepID=A0A8J3UM95_9ACTN|nr:hypothetical protein [Planotetraspora silvatica]GII48489.1 hypothetical protein Psi02_49130 [Planotetraspora silvatica]
MEVVDTPVITNDRPALIEQVRPRRVIEIERTYPRTDRGPDRGQPDRVTKATRATQFKQVVLVKQFKLVVAGCSGRVVR